MVMQTLIIFGLAVCCISTPAVAGELPWGYVQGDEVVSYSYVPNKRWSRQEALGMNAIEYSGATKAMMIYIGLSSSLDQGNYTTPIETMDAYYDNLKAGPWVGLSWWTSAGRLHPKEYPLGMLGYVDMTLVHHTPEHPQGVPYSPEELDRLRKQFIASRMRMFEDVVYGQFGHLNGPGRQENGEPRSSCLKSVSPTR